MKEHGKLIFTVHLVLKTSDYRADNLLRGECIIYLRYTSEPGPYHAAHAKTSQII